MKSMHTEHQKIDERNSNKSILHINAQNETSPYPKLRIIFEKNLLYLVVEPTDALEALIYNNAIHFVVRERLLEAEAPLSYRCGAHEAGYQYWKIEHVEIGDTVDIILEVARQAEKVRQKLD